MKFPALLFSIAVALMAPAANAQLTKEAQALKSFGEELDYASTAPDFVGLAVAVVKNGRIEMIRTYGTTVAGGREKVTPDTVFRLASLSKGFAGTLAALEEKDGKLDLKTKAVSVVPQFRMKSIQDTAAVTLEHVLSQSTGLPPYAYDNLLEAGTPPTDILAKYATVKQTCSPGDCFTYQNTAFNMITPAIEAAAGRSYAMELQQRILTPLDMKTASLGKLGLMSTGNWARPHKRVGMTWVPTPVTDWYYKLPAAGGMNASITDLSKWMIAQMGDRPDVLPGDVLDEIHRKRIDTPAETVRQHSLKTPVSRTWYGFGWRIYDYAGHTVITHSGGVEGYLSQIAWLPESHAGIVVLSNTRGSRAGKIVPDWLDYQLGLPKTDWFRMEEIAEAANTPATASGD